MSDLNVCLVCHLFTLSSPLQIHLDILHSERHRLRILQARRAALQDHRALPAVLLLLHAHQVRLPSGLHQHGHGPQRVSAKHPTHCLCDYFNCTHTRIQHALIAAPYPALRRPALPCPTLPCPVPPCLALPYPALLHYESTYPAVRLLFTSLSQQHYTSTYVHRYMVSILATNALGIDRTYFAAELGLVEPKWITQVRHCNASHNIASH